MTRKFEKKLYERSCMRLLKYKGKPYVGVRWDKYIELRSLTKDDEDFILF